MRNFLSTALAALLLALSLPLYGQSAYFAGAQLKPVFIGTADKSVTTNGTLLTIMPTGIGTATIPANSMQVGSTYLLRVEGYYTKTGSGTAHFRVFLGSTGLTGTASLSTGATTGTRTFRCYSIITCRTTGATGTVRAQNFAIMNAGTNAYVFTFGPSTADTTIDTTAAQTIDLQYLGSPSSNNITTTNCVIEQVF